MNKLVYITLLSFMVCSCMGQTKKEKNKLVDSRKGEWISLFDGKTRPYNPNHRFSMSVNDSATMLIDFLHMHAVALSMNNHTGEP